MNKSEPIFPHVFKIAADQQADVPAEIEPGAAYQIPVEGSLGLLALGAVGILAWRQVRDAAQSSLTPQTTENNK